MELYHYIHNDIVQIFDTISIQGRVFWKIKYIILIGLFD